MTIDGAVEFTQNLFTGSDTQYTAWLRGDNMEGKNYQLGFATDCLGTDWEVRTDESKVTVF